MSSELKDVELGNLSGAEDIGHVKGVILAQEADVKLSGMWSTIITILKTMVGAGILGLPYAFLAGGWLFSIFVFPVIAVLTGYCMVALVQAKDAAQLSRTASPADVGEASYGAVGRIIVAVILCLDSFGVCLSYFIFITYNMFLLTDVRQEAWAVIFFFFFLILSYIRPVKFISYLTLVANVLTLVGLILTLVAVFVAAKPIGEPHMFNWKEFPLFIGIVLFAFQAINIALPAYNMLRNPKRFIPSVLIVLTVGCIAYLLFGLIIYLRLADNSLSMITEAIDVFGVQVAVAVLFIISLCANMVCWIYAIYEVADRLSCANKVYIMSPAEKARILAENESNAFVDESGSPAPNPNPSATPNSIGSADGGDGNHSPSDETGNPIQEGEGDAGGKSQLTTANSSAGLVSSGSASTIVPMQTGAGAGAAATEPEPGFLKRILINWRFWILSTIGRIVVLLIIMIPSITPARDHFASFLGLSGCLTGILMSFLMPMFAQLKLQWKTMPLWQKILDIVIIVVSFPGMIYVTVITLIDLVNSLKEGS